MMAYICSMNIRTNRINQIEGPVEAAARHPYILLLLLFYSVAGVAAGVSAARLAQPAAGTGELAGFFSGLAQGDYRIFPVVLRSAVLNLLFYLLACLPRLWPPLIMIGGLSLTLKGVCLGVSLSCLWGEMGLRGLALGLPLAVIPALFCLAALTLRIVADAKGRIGLAEGSLSLRSWGFLAICVMLESAVAPVALRAFLRK